MLDVEGKLEISYDDLEDMGSLTFRYVEGLQWVTIIIVVSRRGVGSMTIIIRLASQARIQLYLAVLNTDAIHRPEGCQQDVILFSAWYSIPSLRAAYGCPSFGEQRQHIPSAYQVCISSIFISTV